MFYNSSTKRCEFNWEACKKTIQLITRLASRLTTATQWHPDWDSIQKRDRLLGVSMTGYMDAMDLLGWSYNQQKYFLQWVKETAVEAANAYHTHLGINWSTRVTLVKPEGTISQLSTVSSGVHRAYAPYYLRRVRFSKTDPLAQALRDMKLPIVPEVNEGSDLDAVSCNTWVATFPIKTAATIRAIDESAIDQLERYKLFQTNYCDRGHNASVTITLAPEEYDIAAKWIYDNWDDVIGISFLPRFDPSEGGESSHPLMPYEPTVEETYNQLKAQQPQLTEDQLIRLIAQYETAYEETDLDSDCNAKGACPVR